MLEATSMRSRVLIVAFPLALVACGHAERTEKAPGATRGYTQKKGLRSAAEDGVGLTVGPPGPARAEPYSLTAGPKATVRPSILTISTKRFRPFLCFGTRNVY